MEVEIDFTKSAQQNAERYFELSKKAKKKAEGAERSIKELESKRDKEAVIESKKKVKRIVSKEWYEKFNWFFTSNSMLVIGGRSAQQNELINSKYFVDGDLFFHADVFGASVVILKDGEKAPREIREEVAQFAACYSRAWEGGTSSANVYALKRSQVSKSKEKGSLGTGSFLLSGEREWFKNMPMELAAFRYQNRQELIKSTTPVVQTQSIAIEIQSSQIQITPFYTCRELNISSYLTIKPGNSKKSDVAKQIAKKLNYDDIDYIMQHLPAGGSSVR